MKFLELAAVLIALVALLCGCTNDVLSSSHATRADAVDIIARGWIPAVLPDSATEIHESHNVDTNVGHGTFQFGAADMDSFQAALAPVPEGHSVRATSRKELERSGYVFYLYDEFEIAVNWDNREGQFWLGPK